MPNLNTARFTLSGMVTKRSIKDRLDDRHLTVKDFGATGNGTTDDTSAIQAAFNTLYGSPGSPQGETGSTLTSKVLRFPAGDYKISQPLTLNRSYGATLIGAGSNQTRLFWSGAEVEGSQDYDGATPVGPPISALIEAKDSWHQHIEGMTLDAGGVQDVALRLMRFGNSPNHQSGSDGYYRDVCFTNATSNNILAGGEALASERLYESCSFTNCPGNGIFLSHANALNHSFYNCYFANNGGGYKQFVGGCGVFSGCRFHNNTSFDIHHQQSTITVEACHSTSRNFAILNGAITACRHDHASPGVFWSPSFTPPTLGLPYDAPTTCFADSPYVCLTGNHSTNGVLSTLNAGGYAVLMGNRFDNAAYKSTYYTAAGAGGWENGAAF